MKSLDKLDKQASTHSVSRKKLEEADVDKIRDGSIADELDFIGHGIRSRLDDIKRRELERLRHLTMKQYEMDQGIDQGNIKIPGHLEMQAPTFEKEDLKKLIAVSAFRNEKLIDRIR